MKPFQSRRIVLKLRSATNPRKPALADIVTLPIDAVMRTNRERPYFDRFSYDPAPNGAVFDGFKWRHY